MPLSARAHADERALRALTAEVHGGPCEVQNAYRDGAEDQSDSEPSPPPEGEKGEPGQGRDGKEQGRWPEPLVVVHPDVVAVRVPVLAACTATQNATATSVFRTTAATKPVKRLGATLPSTFTDRMVPQARSS